MDKKNWEQTFSQVKMSVMASAFPLGTSEEEKEVVFNELVSLLLRKRVFQTTGRFCDCRENALNYLLEVMPRLEEHEIQLILKNPDQFYRKFCFSPTKNTNSLYSKFKRMGVDLQDRYIDISVSELLDRYCAENKLSPYELCEEGYVIDSFLEEIEEPSTVDLAMEFD